MSNYYYQDPKAPAASSLHVGTAVAIRHEGRILLDHRRDGSWGLFGGALEVGESAEECARREILEETNLALGDLTLVGVFSHPSRIIERAGVAVQSLTICFSANALSTDLRISSESRDAGFYSLEEISALPIVARHSMIIPCLYSPDTWPIVE